MVSELFLLLIFGGFCFSAALRSGFVLKHSIDVGAGVIDADRFLCLASLRSQILDLGSSFLASAVDTACKAGEKWHPDRKQLRRNSKQSSKPILLSFLIGRKRAIVLKRK
ncbi:uncharacterized protein LOC110268262 [Arachis ipaensis]|uniref:uncharacterized protein LOC110268262 n=1 Tax=Arachis ipaensis TaxID=130454 RepID=UPI000A2B82E3|nr:uncharacterized protein LOC110268262 [Arachis ipaensis]